MWDWLTTTAVALGVALRVGAVVERWDAPVHGDVEGFLWIARHLSWIQPWATEHREPLWIVLVKVTTGPFGYSHLPLVLWSLAASVGTVGLAASFLRRNFPPVAALAGTLLVAVHPLLVLDSAAGLRESTSTLLGVATAWALTERRWLLVSVLAAVLFGVRWELGLLVVVLLALAAAIATLPRRVPAAALLLAAVWIGPFMASNAARHGDALHHSNTHAGWYQGMETPGWSGSSSGRPETSWGSYYLSFVGPKESAKRATTGVIRIQSVLVAGALDQDIRHDPQVADFETARWQMAVALAGILLLVWPNLHHPVGRWALLVFAGGSAAYGALDWVMPYRLASFLVLPLAVMVAVGVTRVTEMSSPGDQSPVDIGAASHESAGHLSASRRDGRRPVGDPRRLVAGRLHRRRRP